MKKFVLFFVVAVMAAAMSQAVSFSWSVSNIKDGEGTKIPAGGFIAYLFNTSDYSVAAATADAKDGKLNVGKALDSSTGTGAGKVVSDEYGAERIIKAAGKEQSDLRSAGSVLRCVFEPHLIA